MIRVEVITDTDVLQALSEAVQQSPKALYTLVNKSILPDSQRRLEAALNREPGPVKYKFEFATTKSRKYYFANFELPYKRTGAVRKWALTLKGFDGQTFTISAENPVRYAQWVFGPRQVPGHAKTGWPNADEVILTESGKLSENLIEGWFSVIEPGKGVRVL